VEDYQSAKNKWFDKMFGWNNSSKVHDFIQTGSKGNALEMVKKKKDMGPKIQRRSSNPL